MDIFRRICSNLITKPIIRTAFHTSSISHVKNDKKIWLKSMPKKDEGIQAINFVSSGSSLEKQVENICEFPNLDTENQEFNGIKYSDLPIVHIYCTKNNTKLICVQPDNIYTILNRSCGMDGFKNCRKGTNIAAHTTSVVVGKKLQLKGIRTIKIGIKGMGPGRLASIQGLVASGLQVASISDLTNYTKYPKRPPRPRSL